MAWKIGIWITRIVATVLLAAFLSIWTTGYIVTSYVQALLKEYEIPMQVEPLALSDVWGMLWGSQPQPPSSSVADQPSDDQAQGKSQNTGQSPQQGQVQGDIEGSDDNDMALDGHTEELAEGESSEQAVEDDWEQEAVDVFAPIETGEGNAMEPEDIEASRESLAAEDKERLFELLMLKLPSESWQLFSTYIEDGLTDQELVEIQQIMAQHLNKEEYEELVSMLKNY